MSGKLILVSNRLPYNITLSSDENSEELFKFKQSNGGLVSGLMPLREDKDTVWLGWADTKEMALDEGQQQELIKEFRARDCEPVFIGNGEINSYYDGFSNSAIWPLFHYFAQFCRFDKSEWDSYKRVNKIFCDAIIKIAKPGDTIWIHDYHLMLLPQMVREKMPDVSIGFFLHIPFPSYEMFRIIPCRENILKGILGADLIGFHTYDYTRHFLSSCRRILGIENQYGTIIYNDRIIQSDAFPLGIDYDLYAKAAKRKDIKEMADEYIKHNINGGKVILSIERLDYSKGILNSLNAYDAFLESHPEWREKVIFSLIVVPSRESVDSYQELKRQVNERVGSIEGKYSTSSWSPIDYYYRSLSFRKLCSFYLASDVMLVAPLRDGMNLVSKEYLAVHDDKPGALILSEMAGSAYELSDAIVINPFNTKEYGEAFEKALTMPDSEQLERNQIMQKRLKQYTSTQWSKCFMKTLKNGTLQQTSIMAEPFEKEQQKSLIKEYNSANKRGIVLDYDGTLTGFKKNPEDAYPDEELIDILNRLSEKDENEVVLISGRDCDTMNKWFSQIPLDMISEHGIWQYRNKNKDWAMSEHLDDAWKTSIRNELESFVIRTPGSFIEEKNYSLVWHCRGATEELGQRRMREINKLLTPEVESKDLMLLQGNKVIEIKPKSINKGRAAYSWLQEKDCDFTLSAGDDTTDEDMFHVMPDDAWTIKVGMDPTEAKYYVEGTNEIRQLLKQLAYG